jgi:hypothetical protein
MSDRIPEQHVIGFDEAQPAWMNLWPVRHRIARDA